jgi:hypothetical protein
LKYLHDDSLHSFNVYFIASPSSVFKSSKDVIANKKTSSLSSLSGQNIIKRSIEEDLVDRGRQTVFYGFIDAFREHRPITISPDIIWILIAQGFYQHAFFSVKKCLVNGEKS